MLVLVLLCCTGGHFSFFSIDVALLSTHAKELAHVQQLGLTFSNNFRWNKYNKKHRQEGKCHSVV
jgi:hypothetical protein